MSGAIGILIWIAIIVIGGRAARWILKPSRMPEYEEHRTHGFEVIFPAVDAGKKERDNDHG